MYFVYFYTLMHHCTLRASNTVCWQAKISICLLHIHLPIDCTYNILIRCKCFVFLYIRIFCVRHEWQILIIHTFVLLAFIFDRFWASEWIILDSISTRNPENRNRAQFKNMRTMTSSTLEPENGIVVVFGHEEIHSNEHRPNEMIFILVFRWGACVRSS